MSGTRTRSQRKTNRMLLLEWLGWKRLCCNSVWIHLCWCCVVHHFTSTLIDLGRTVREWVILQQHPEYRDTEAPDPKSMLNQQNNDGARAPSPRRVIMMCLSVCVTQRLPFTASFLFFIQKHESMKALDGKHAASQNPTAATGGVVKLITDPYSWWWECAPLM